MFDNWFQITPEVIESFLLSVEDNSFQMKSARDQLKS